ncbi:MAG TPA: hypothetical protein VMW19_11530 [Myxococcota bacterium]|nr:hypothetical protein [Myxococcota bacterium]
MTARGRILATRAGAVLCVFALYAAARVWLSDAFPWHRAFDDDFFLPETFRWIGGKGYLGEKATFARVPVWHWLLGAHFEVFRSYGLVVLQAWIVLGAIALYAAWVGAGRGLARWLPLLVFALSPQILLYSRQGVNELWIGLLTLGVMLLGERLGAAAALPMGALAGLALCTKPAAGLIAVAAAGYALRGAPRPAAALARVAIGAALVAVPILAWTAWERGSWLLDNTTAFNLSGMSVQEWRALPDAATREAVGLARFREAFAADPRGYLTAAAARAVRWLVRPSTLDLSHFYPDYPKAWLGAGDAVAFALLAALAVVGTRRRDAFLWSMAAAWTAACAFPYFTPRSPKIVLLFPMLLLAERGVVRLAAWRERAPALPAAAPDRMAAREEESA